MRTTHVIVPLLFIAGVLALAGPAPALPGSGSPGRASTIKVYHAFGDSVTAVTGSPLYPNQIATNFGLTLTNRAVSGYTSDQMNEIELFPNEYPTTSSPQINTILIGTNDANLFGFSGEADYDANLYAAVSWLAVPSSAKESPLSCAQGGGTWTPNVNAQPFYPATPSETSPAQNATLTCSITVNDGVLYTWIGANAGGATYTYAIDGGSPVSGTAISAVGLIRVTGLSAGSHTFVLTDTGTSSPRIVSAGIGTVPASNACCVVVVAGLPYQLGDAVGNTNGTTSTSSAVLNFASTPANICSTAGCAYIDDVTTPAALPISSNYTTTSGGVTGTTVTMNADALSPGVGSGDTIEFGRHSVTAAYYSDAQTILANLAGDGLNVSFVNIRSSVNSTTDLANNLHPNQTGINQIAADFIAVWP